MCLILLAWQVHEDYPLVLAANRDEFHHRPALPLAFWRDAPEIVGGRDLQAGGGWLACHTDGRFAAVTNVRQGTTDAPATSRGELVSNYLKNDLQPIDFIKMLAQGSYAGFNLFLGSRQALYYFSNRNQVKPQRLKAGIYGLSNHCLDTPWPKLLNARRAFAAQLGDLPEPEPFFHLLNDKTQADDRDLPATGIPLALERLLSAIFIVSPDYGTRSSTLMLRHKNGAFRCIERRFTPEGHVLDEQCVQTSRMSTGV
jgi:uncharacterized protein with NRDE domain